MLASPLPALSTAFSFGFFARLFAPDSWSFSFGLKPSPWHALHWYGTEAGKAVKDAGSAGLAPPPRSVAPTAIGAQLVPFREKFLRSRLTSTELMSSRAPPNTCGIGSETAWTWAVSRSTDRATLSTTEPRSNGPAVAGVTTARDRGAPAYGPARKTLPPIWSGSPLPVWTTAMPTK